MNIQRSEILQQTPYFIIPKHGKAIPIAEAVIVDATEILCKGCRKRKGESDTFHEGECSGCILKSFKGEGEHMMCMESTAFKETAFLVTDEEAKLGQLLLINTSGDNMIYIDVPVETWRGLQTAKSCGKFYNSDIRGKYTKL